VTRFAAAALTNAANQTHVPYVVFADLDFLSAHVRINSSDRAIEFGGNTYLGGGQLVGIGEVTESAALNPEKISLTLSGVDTSLISTVLNETYHGRSATLYVCYLGSDGQLVGTPEMLWEGRMDTLGIQSEEGGSTIDLICESRLVLWNEATELLYTHEHHGLLTASAPDDFFNRVVDLMDKVVKWGGAMVTTGIPTSIGQPAVGSRRQPR
jgi:hypothetical protein